MTELNDNRPPGPESAAKPGKRSRKRRKSRRHGASKAASGSQQPTPAPPVETDSSPIEPAVEAEAEEAGAQSAAGGGPRKLFINADEPEECRIALVENGKLEAFHVATISGASTKGNIYKGRVVSVEASLQAAFVDIGTSKNAFLPFDEVHPEYYGSDVAPDAHWKNLASNQILEPGQEVLVEILKEPTGNKGAHVTTYLSFPGRFLVLMPGSDSHGISRKIEDEAQRGQIKELMASLKVPEGIGYIVRTASQDITKTALSKDLRYLLNLWKEVRKKGQTLPAPALLHEDQDLIAKFMRDHFTADIQEVVVDNEAIFTQIKKFLDLLPATQKGSSKVRHYTDARPLFNHHNIEQQIEQIFQPMVKLPSGGSIVINPTEALVAIDVNSGGTGKDKKFEEAIFLANLEAAEEIARQIRLRDLGGLIVIDFIDLRSAARTRDVEKRLKASMKRDKAKADFTSISKFGLMQVSRQRMGAPVSTGNFILCPHCLGRGFIRSVETLSLAYLRQIQTKIIKKDIKKMVCSFPGNVAHYLLNKKREDILALEKRYEVAITIEAVPDMPQSDMRIQVY